MGQILGIDVGTKTLGLAVSDGAGRVALVLTTLRRAGMARDLDALAKIIEEREIAEVVVGWPLNLDGTPGTMSAEIEKLELALAARCAVTIHRHDERMTTVAAERALLEADLSRKRRREVIDKVAATMILQAYLDRRQSLGGGGEGA